MTYPKKLQEAFGKQPVFTLADVRRLLPKASAGYARLLLHNLLKAGKIFRISRGIYSFHDEALVAGFAFRPFYYGCQDALSLHGLWEQETNPVVITARKVRAGMRKFAGGNYVVRRIERRMFFGYEMMKCAGWWVPVSDVEKTLIDMVHFRQHVGEELGAEFESRIERKKMRGYLKRCPDRVARKVGKIIAKR